MEPNKANLERCILAGFIGTLLVTIVLYLAPELGLPKMDIAAMMGSLLHGGGTAPEPMSTSWWVGMALHFVAGTIVFPLLYAYFLANRLFGNSGIKGTTWGLNLWVLSEAVLMPIVGMGFFSSRAPDYSGSLASSLIAFLIYGSLLGGLAEATAHFHWPWHRPCPHKSRIRTRRVNQRFPVACSPWSGEPIFQQFGDRDICFSSP